MKTVVILDESCRLIRTVVVCEEEPSWEIEQYLC